MRKYFVLLSTFFAFNIVNAQSIIWITVPGADTTMLFVVSGDGRLAGGEYFAPGPRYMAFVWTLTLGPVSLPRSGFMVTASWVCAIPVDGSFAVGNADSLNRKFYVFKWTPDSGAVVLPGIPPNSFSCAVSYDGSTLGGGTYNSSFTSSWGWRMVDGTITDTLVTSKPYTEVYAISGDGRVLGVASGDYGSLEAYRWVPDGDTLVLLSSLGGMYEEVYDISYDGSVLVGTSKTTEGEWHAVMWYADGSVLDLGTLGGRAAWANGVTADGNTVVGASTYFWADIKRVRRASGYPPNPIHRYRIDAVEPNWVAFIWTPDSGMRDMNEVYSDILGDHILLEAYDISPDGRYITGVGYNISTGELEGFILDRYGVSVEEYGENGKTVLRVKGTKIEINSSARIYDLSGRLVGEIKGGGTWEGKPGVYLVRWRGGSRTVILR